VRRHTDGFLPGLCPVEDDVPRTTVIVNAPTATTPSITTLPGFEHIGSGWITSFLGRASRETQMRFVATRSFLRRYVNQTRTMIVEARAAV